jgi:hypothetical protein
LNLVIHFCGFASRGCRDTKPEKLAAYMFGFESGTDSLDCGGNRRFVMRTESALVAVRSLVHRPRSAGLQSGSPCRTPKIAPQSN